MQITSTDMDRTLLSQTSAKPVPQEQQVFAAPGKTLPAPVPEPAAARMSVEEAVQTVNRQFEVAQRSVRIVARADASETVIEVVDVETDQIIRQIPEEKLLKLASWWAENGLQADKAPQGLTFDETA